MVVQRSQRGTTPLRESVSIRLLSAMGAVPSCYAVAYCTGTGRNNSGLKNRLAMAAKMIGAKPIRAA